MKYFPIMRLVVFGAILFISTALSCQDHHIPDPVTNCNRVDGLPRALNCEFEFVSAEFYKLDPVTGKIIYGTVTPANSNLVIREAYRGEFIRSSVSPIFSIPLKITIKIKRIAPSPSGVNKYLLRNNVESNFPFDPTGNREGDSRFGGGYILEPDENLEPVTIDIAVGETYTYEASTSWAGRYELANDDKFIYPVNTYWLLIQNVETSEKLRNAPYNYKLYRDQAEGKIKILPTIVSTAI